MCNGDDSAACEFAPDGLLYLCVRVKVDTGSGLINTYHLGPSQQCSGKTYQLTLTNREHTALFLHLHIQPSWREQRLLL